MCGANCSHATTVSAYPVDCGCLCHLLDTLYCCLSLNGRVELINCCDSNSKLIAVTQSQSKKKKEQTEAEPLVKPKDVTGEPTCGQRGAHQGRGDIDDPDMKEFP